ncbi:MAG: selenide, water dikinase SelD, partial [Thiobacillus sp.]|nr:selenide, water dikinase SelD [Thiobacillus sp.]
FEFGRIAATNALSDVYAMGGRPLFALAIVGMPNRKLPNSVIRQILAGGEAVCKQAGIPIAGGHSIDAPEPIYGLVGIGVVDPRKVKQNSGGQAGDHLILGKPLGVGIYSAALKKGLLSADQYAAMIAATTQLNTAGADLAAIEGVNAMTDITGFGLLGHLLEITRASKVAAHAELARLPLLPGIRELAQGGHITGASERNWASYGSEVRLADGIADWQRALLTDPQTSGGLLVSCTSESRETVLDTFRRHGFAQATEIGRLDAGSDVSIVV